MPVWVYIAKHLGCPIWEAKERVPASEFPLWKADFVNEQESKWVKGSDPIHHYLAQLTYAVVSIASKSKTKPESFLLDFGVGQDRKRGNTSQHKNLFLGYLGLSDASNS